MDDQVRDDSKTDEFNDGDISERRGFPNAALNGRAEFGLNVNDLVIANPASTFFMSVDSDQYVDLGVEGGDYVAIDRSIEPKGDSLVVINIEGEFRIARMDQIDQQVEIWGTITWVLHKSHNVRATR